MAETIKLETESEIALWSVVYANSARQFAEGLADTAVMKLRKRISEKVK